MGFTSKLRDAFNKETLRKAFHKVYQYAKNHSQSRTYPPEKTHFYKVVAPSHPQQLKLEREKCIYPELGQFIDEKKHKIWGDVYWYEVTPGKEKEYEAKKKELKLKP